MKTKKTKKPTIRYSYKVWWIDPSKEDEEKKLTPYSKGFDTLEESEKWYYKYGRDLEKRFNRKLVLTETGNTNTNN